MFINLTHLKSVLLFHNTHIYIVQTLSWRINLVRHEYKVSVQDLRFQWQWGFSSHEPCCLLHQSQDGGSMVLCNVGTLPSHNTPYNQRNHNLKNQSKVKEHIFPHFQNNNTLNKTQISTHRIPVMPAWNWNSSISLEELHFLLPSLKLNRT